MQHISINLKPIARSPESRWYITHEELHNQLIYASKNGCSDMLASMFIKLVDNMLTGRRFFAYPDDVKEDMKSFALYKLVRCVKSYNPLKLKSKNCVNYVTRVVFTAFLTEIAKYYKRINILRQLSSYAMHQLENI